MNISNNLCHTYRDYPGISAVRFAILNSEEEMPIYRIDPDRLEDYPGWGMGVSSFKKEKLVHSDKVRPEDLISEWVACISLH